MSKLILWEGAAIDPSGYGEATRNYILGLDDIKVPIKLKNRVFWRGAKMDLEDKLPRLVKMTETRLPEKGSDVTVVFNLTPENYHIYGNVGRHVCMTTFETSSIPDHWLVPMRAMDDVITYSKFNRETFIEAGINRPIHIVPHGVDTENYRQGLEPMESIRKSVGDRYVFGSNFDWTNRKNPQALLMAYYTAFEGNKDVALVLKVYHQYPIAKSVENIKQNIAVIKASMKITDFPMVVLVTDMMKPSDMPHFYASLDCFVLPTRGEGWGLPLSEAMASGLPTIATGWGGNMEFMDATNSYPLEYKLVDIDGRDVVNQPHYAGHKWAEVDFDHLISTMKGVYDNRVMAFSVGTKARVDMCKKWTWKTACEKLKSTLEGMGR